MSAFKYEKDVDGIVTVTMDMPGPVNAMNQLYRDIMTATVQRLEQEAGLTGVVIASTKSTFFAGGDLNELTDFKPGDEADFQGKIEQTKNDLRRLERLPVPVVAAINGAALGGGFEIALACNHRVLLNNSSAIVGLPEVSLGLLPGAGGIVRLVHILGLEKALPLLLEGKRLKPTEALGLGLVDELIEQVDALVPAAKAWIKAQAKDEVRGAQPWDRKGHKIPSGTVQQPQVAQMVAGALAMTARNTRGLLPAPERILAVAAEATLLDFDAALLVETRGLTYLAASVQAKNIINTMFFQMNEVNGGSNRPEGVNKSKVGKLGILGAGMMGNGIAHVAAKAGIEVVLLDVSLESAEKGKTNVEKQLAKLVSQGRLSEEKKAGILGLIKPTADYADLQGMDFIVEAVFESVELKGKVTQLAEAHLQEQAVLGTNTSTLPITLLAQASKRPANFIGIHFFSPVEKMPLVEIICGEQTSDVTLAKAFDFARQIGKTAIVVNDSLGFFTSRTFGSYFDEGCKLLLEGVDPLLIDNLGKQIGMPVGPLTVLDEVSLELMRKVNETQKEMGVFSTVFDNSHSDEVGNILIKDHSRSGRHYGGGFYDYPQDGEKTIWPGLYDLFYKAEVSVSVEDIKDRLLFRQVIEAVKCLQEGVLRSVADGNVGSILGIGAPLWTGGFLQFVNGYGLERFIKRAEELAQAYGDCFAPPALLLEKANAGETLR
ncbi:MULTISPECIES: 3-hydroxyacyl-CoA dehydrogenase NAD-binding domain-containing protein [unclassified Pseudomonas]|uniref:3-hydroxyacyl-CoA dehydrogenase NAD-binding domain-containing protein n=1 Tax=unclassified Pseudomonas TaxID=196821 RepID=UPI000C87FE72|nr:MULTISPECIES: 3-hydroxyacyl-CoA dehydrogenase NAD-binding domain-containing protein [unclassified Pseudomonas]PMX27470.1 3-hydroxyacyl-CoA dehydrogenase [Pseudomonas sp. GW460-12]PMX34462.1 3-hydroxyacyl-CoA dehydrogenase [Pseudomonas sp. MPR-R2A4]PMX41869.1 3-hydroxyacyl-CoA dehydrogenase [Pseudomonas sp. MPR-R2A7]PMX53825.1 3-hydroxyacyl-CoA dehydrogenase [Pseudomonas sp. MPR-R2A6]PMX91306.1 3-hydroxyacyl-CoA dehydrogenase [Pseudomonas sp. MPR-R2A3]